MPRTVNSPLVGARLHGSAELLKALEQLPTLGGNPVRVIRAAQRKALKPVEATAQTLAPFEFGDLRDSIKIQTVPKRLRSHKNDQTLAVGPTKEGFYGLFHEFGWDLHISGGTRRMPARAFMRPAWDQHRVTMLRTMQEEIWKGIERVRKRFARKVKRTTGANVIT